MGQQAQQRASRQRTGVCGAAGGGNRRRTLANPRPAARAALYPSALPQRIVRGHHVATGVKALVVPGSVAVQKAAEREGLDATFREAGFEWRDAGCSMCLGMNPDKLEGDQVCAASSNRNFKGRQGSPTGRTLLMSPAMVAAAAITGVVTDVRELVDEVPAGVR